MANKQIDLNTEVKSETFDLTNKTFDLTLRLGDGSPESSKKRKTHPEEGTSAGQTLEERIKALEHRLQQVERLVDKRAHELAARMDQHFLYSGQSIQERLARNSTLLNEIHSLLHSVVLSFRPSITSEHQNPSSIPKPGIASSSTRRPPRL